MSNSYPQKLCTGLWIFNFQFRHAVLTCGYTNVLDKGATVSNATRARRIAQALGGTFLAGLCIVLGTNTAYARDWSIQSLALNYIQDSKEYNCFNTIISRESHWNPKAKNPRSSAYGLGQLLSERSKDAFEQVLHAVAYGHYRYGTLCRAEAFHLRHGWW